MSPASSVSPASSASAPSGGADPRGAAGPGQRAGSVCVIGLGPGDPRYLTPAAAAALAEAEDLIGYAPYLARVPERPDLVRHASDNRVEVERARHALALAAAGRRVAVVSGGDPGVFAMAAALFEALEAGDPAWRALPITVEPGITAMLAAAARVGAPLGGDFCALSLSDNLKPWEVITARLDAVLRADLVVALYNPISRARPWQLSAALGRAAEHRGPGTPVILARAVGRPDEAVRILPLAEAREAPADMATLVIIGASATRLIPREGAPPFVYTPRSVEAAR
ncbi:precorrin-3B C17-methyltransferase [Methylobacterium sp. 4-46]|uniref:precorrin-3B C(17)-methyltransferase n=1 Tax=unclassified Methylobacterium TaxID=2615210 RepID=UPI000165C836|nr:MULTISPECIES: precorrin-3B C(17)-methyltransferase [Methylobacterium]ACA16897.1 precorrin-3B C17-methyltransferase [Methylobacterium sp. 4-46]WFT82587.1 precorrin-3B C(17)-methyltransferase [Methylobacterium nodulans]